MVAAGVQATLTFACWLTVAFGACNALTDDRSALCVPLLAARAGRMNTAARATAARSTTANLLCMDYPLFFCPAPCRNGACTTHCVPRSRLFGLSAMARAAEVWMSLAGPMVQGLHDATFPPPEEVRCRAT